MNLFKPKQDKRTLLEKVSQALILMQPDEIKETEDGTFIITLLPSNPYYKANNPLAIAIEFLKRAKLESEPGYQLRDQAKVTFDIRCENNIYQKPKRGEKRKNG